ncbi:hypothetical protein IB260_00565 [Pseudomonas sp. PDM23]|uniref:hypothetical protein n=1 Tax=unclassified Pseudomonas TaxID=196821 RepID=UPI001783631B|nr:MULTISPECIES: hypothetical protein [unclassified Pseudomonas]MBD9573786.1 hypothetical protein [Pseudomonas sp. PDM23]MBD9671624.1 hypothetical protein [Pseudomonas sp. PDM21]
MSDFLVWCPDYGHEEDDAMHVRDSYDHAAAAREWAERYEQRNADYNIANGECVTVMVHRLGEDTQAFAVSGYAQPVYTATAIREQP